MKCIQQVATLVVLLALLAACSSVSGPPAEPVTVTFIIVTLPWLSSQPADYERLAETFHEANPHINVLVKFVSVEELPQGLAEADFLTDPEWGVDVVMTGADSFPGLAQQGLLRDLQPSLEADQALQSEDFYPPVLDALRWQGRVTAFPRSWPPG
jgi:ABC-type glycerol-3-phosphate transport system substrate-binding protein